MAKNFRRTAFRDFLQACSLMDLECKGCAFTWTNRRAGEENVKARLDRVLCTMEWRIAYPTAEAIALPAIGSDYNPILLSLFPKTGRKPREFKYEAYWLEDEDCRQLVKRSWEASKGKNMADKLHLVAVQLATWSKRRFPNARKRIEELKNELQTLMNSQDI